MGEPGIVTTKFLVTCINYEYLKNEECPLQAHQNLCEMMLADEVREDVTKDYGGSDNGTSERASQDSEASTIGSLTSQDSNVDGWGGSEIQLKDHSPGPSNARPVAPKRPRTSTDSEKSANDDLLSKLEGAHPKSSHIVREDLDDEDADPNTNLNLLKQNEEDLKIRIIPFEIIKAIFDDIGILSGSIEELRPPTLLSELRRKVYLPLSLFRPLVIGPVFPGTLKMDKIESSLDFGKVNISLTLENANKSTDMEYWEDSEGTWIWYDNEIRFIKNLHYEDLAANAFINSLDQLSGKLDLLSFEVEDKTKWNPDHSHSTKFYKKIKKWPRTTEQPRSQFRIKTLYMRILKTENNKAHPFKLRYIRKTFLQDIIIRVWDDGRPGEEHIRSLDDFVKCETYKFAKTLKIDDENLYMWHPDIRRFEYVSVWQMTLDDFIRIRDELATKPPGKKLPPERELTITTKCPFDSSHFKTELNTDANGVITHTSKSFVIKITVCSDHQIKFEINSLDSSIS